MDNGSLNTNGINTQREATMQRGGGGERIATLTRCAVSFQWKKFCFL